ncbi:MAG: 3-deoxy-manno-octulosonate cytidylyltransferase [Daejeonella sp.]
MMKILGIIPARFASTRFPGKPLADIAGKSMIQRVYEQAKKSSSLSEVIVATDDLRILEHVKDFGGLAELTSEKHQSGTDRCAEVSNNNSGYDIIINIQGDEPFIEPEQIDVLARCFTDENVSLATLIKQITEFEELVDTNTPKVIVDQLSNAIYFSRTPLPVNRDSELKEWLNKTTYFKHIGIYGYRKSTLQKITKLPISEYEKAEALEQLRWIENGLKIRVAKTNFQSIAVDTPQDLERAIKHLKSLS